MPEPLACFTLPTSKLKARLCASLAGLCLIALCLGQKSIGLIDFDQLFNSDEAQSSPALFFRLQQWQKALRQVKNQNHYEQVLAINEFFNAQLQFESDQSIWKTSDYWATPLESLSRGAGDCEDYTIAKYISLLAVGIAPEKLRLVYVKAQLPNSNTVQAHMVLAYYPKPNDIPLVLDNLIGAVRPANERPDLQPIFSFNGQGLWLQGSTKKAVNNPEARLSRWRALLERMRNQGINHS